MEKNPKLVNKRSKTGIGSFAGRQFLKGQKIAEYTGEKITDKEADKRNSVYLFTLDNGFTIDGAPKSNEARYINHSCRPNASADIERGKIIIRAERKIRIGEEITFDYGEEYYNDILRFYGCKCGHCSGRKKALYGSHKKKKATKKRS